MYGGTPLAQTIWSALSQPMPRQYEAAAELLRAGADATRVTYPTGNPRLDELLESYRTG